MDLWKLILDVLKFGAIAVGSISGLIGTLTETKDKTSGKPTLWGKRIVTLIVLSGTIAVAAQSIELYLKHQSDLKEEDARKKAAVDTNNILTNASKAATGIDAAITQQNTLLEKLKENVEKTDEVRQNAEKFGKELQEQRESIDNSFDSVLRKQKESGDAITGKIGGATEALQAGLNQTLVDLWLQNHAFGTVSGTAGFKIDLPTGAPPDGLDHWLTRVTARYKEAKRRNEPLDRGVPWGNGTLGDEYIEVNANTDPKRNWDLYPRGDSEAFVEQLLFNPYVMYMVSKDASRTHLLAPSVVIDTKVESVKVSFNSATQRPNKIETFSAGPGRFNPIPGQFTNWLDLYGAMLIARIRLTADPKPEALALARYWTLSFKTENNYWHAEASIPAPDGENVVVDRPGSVVVVKADWNTLGKVPNDYPGKRLLEFGPLTKTQ